MFQIFSKEFKIVWRLNRLILVIVAEKREERSTYMATIVSGDPVRARRDIITLLARVDKVV